MARKTGHPRRIEWMQEWCKKNDFRLMLGGEWGNPAELPPICDSFVGNHSKNCEKCEHDYECHKEAKLK